MPDEAVVKKQKIGEEMLDEEIQPEVDEEGKE